MMDLEFDVDVEETEATGIVPYVSFVIAKHNRKGVLLETLGALAGVDRDSGLLTQTVVVDNASTDGTAAAVAEQFPSVLLLRESRNRGACARNAALPRLTGKYVLFLDDDSYPMADSLERMIGYFAENSSLAAAVFDVVLPNGSHECSAYPKVFIGCGTGFRRAVLVQAGGLPADFFMQAEEYDLSLRLLEAGHDIRRFTDLRVMHQKTAAARKPARTMRLDVRNNLMVVTRYFPQQWKMAFALDWMRRYWWIAQTQGWRHQLAFWIGVTEGALRSLKPGHRRPISLAAFERFGMIRLIHRRLDLALRMARHRSILLVDVGKNILPYYLAAEACDVKIVAIADSQLAKAGREYHHIPVVTDADAALLEFDAAVVANVSPVHASRRAQDWRHLTRRPVIDLFEEAQTLAKAA